MKKSTFSLDELTIWLKHALIYGKFPNILINENVTPLHKKDDLTDKTNFRQVNVFTILSKMFDQINYNPLGKYMDAFLNKLLCVFRKAHSIQHALFKLLQRWHKELDNSGLVGIILMDFSKAVTFYFITL